MDIWYLTLQPYILAIQSADFVLYLTTGNTDHWIQNKGEPSESLRNSVIYNHSEIYGVWTLFACFEYRLSMTHLFSVLGEWIIDLDYIIVHWWMHFVVGCQMFKKYCIKLFFSLQWCTASSYKLKQSVVSASDYLKAGMVNITQFLYLKIISVMTLISKILGGGGGENKSISCVKSQNPRNGRLNLVFCDSSHRYTEECLTVTIYSSLIFPCTTTWYMTFYVMKNQSNFSLALSLALKFWFYWFPAPFEYYSFSWPNSFRKFIGIVKSWCWIGKSDKSFEMVDNSRQYYMVY